MTTIPDYPTFERLCDAGNLVPVCREMLADLETPVSVLARLIHEPDLFLLESCEQGERFGRYSFIGLRPRGVFRVENGKAFLTEQGETRELSFGQSPFFALRELLKEVHPAVYPGLPPLFGGAVGYMGYETVNEFEALPPPKQPLEDPASLFLLTDDMLVFDNIRHMLTVVACARPGEFPNRRAAYEDAVARIDSLCALLRKPLDFPAPVRIRPPRLSGNMSREGFCEMVDRAQHAIHEGECIQVVLSQKFEAELPVPPLALYRALRHVNPSPYTFFLKHNERILVGSSPETMVKLENGRSALRPIAGTRKRGATPAEDRARADELLSDEKERAEHLMLVDLARNDLGRTAVAGSVQVGNFMRVERYSHVMHLVSDVEALLAEDKDGFDLVAAAFPAGTLSGAPKIRAMELIRELEPGPRGVYGGGVGYFGYTGNLDLAITIRTVLLRGGRITIQAGAGIVYDSVPEKEYEETLNKAAALFSAIRFACELGA